MIDPLGDARTGHDGTDVPRVVGAATSTVDGVEGPESALTRQCGHILMTRAGLEIGVASTKAFTTQLTVLLLLAAALAEAKHRDPALIRQVLEDLGQAPQQAREVLAIGDRVREVAEEIAEKPHALFLGRGPEYPIAMEGALKLKEISYIHAEGYPAAEMKHGPIALISDKCPSFFLAPHAETFQKLMANIQEIKARGGKVIAVASEGDNFPDGLVDDLILLPDAHEAIQPILATIPVQLLSYHIAVQRGCDVDKPRNLAKSVTVE